MGLTDCSCPDCETVCSKYEECVGYEYVCCKDTGEKCMAGARILFSKGTRPRTAPESFDIQGPYGSKTYGKGYEGSGSIVNTSENEYETFTSSCFRQLKVNSTGADSVLA